MSSIHDYIKPYTARFVNYRYYSQPMTKVNYKTVSIPFIHPLKEITDGEYTFRIRSSHGFLHAITAMELLPKIDELYTNLVGDTYTQSMDAIATHFKISKEELVDLLSIAVLFHDSAREGDGMDLWDPQSADACKKYLIKCFACPDDLAEFISSTIRWKDEPDLFKETFKTFDNADFARQLVNMCDTLEVLRTRDVFKPEFMPIAKHVSSEVMVFTIIPGLVVPHRKLISEQGRLAKKATIEYNKDGHHYVDTNIPKNGIDNDKMFKTYLDKSKEYNLSILEITDENLDLVVARTLEGIINYQKTFKSGIQLFHHGLFSPRYHGERGQNRANFYANKLNNNDISLSEKAQLLQALFTSNDGKTIKEFVLHSFNQMNETTVLNQINTLVYKLNPDVNAETLSHKTDEIINVANNGSAKLS